MIANIYNPFIINSQYAGDKYFCDRVSETAELVNNIVNSRNSVLISPRRMGKSALIKHCFAQSEISNNFTTIFVDLYSTGNAREFTLLLGKEVFKMLQSTQKRFAAKFYQYVRSLVGTASIDPLTGMPTFNVSLGQIRQPEVTLEEIFSCLESSPKPCVLAIDEFQQLAEYPEKNMVALLRTYVQRCVQTRFIFSGSKRRMMQKLFNSPSEPFYMSCRNMYLDPIDRSAYYSFARNHFNQAKKEINAECFDIIYDTYDGHTWYIQHLLNQLYQDTPKGKTAGREMIEIATLEIIQSYARTYQEMLLCYSDRQKELMIAIAKVGRARAISSESFVTSNALASVSSVQSAARTLLDDETIVAEGNEYYLSNRFFSLWLKDRY